MCGVYYHCHVLAVGSANTGSWLTLAFVWEGETSSRMEQRADVDASHFAVTFSIM